MAVRRILHQSAAQSAERLSVASAFSHRICARNAEVNSAEFDSPATPLLQRAASVAFVYFVRRFELTHALIVVH